MSTSRAPWMSSTGARTTARRSENVETAITPRHVPGQGRRLQADRRAERDAEEADGPRVDAGEHAQQILFLVDAVGAGVPFGRAVGTAVGAARAGIN